jgi:hypothetical protein
LLPSFPYFPLSFFIPWTEFLLLSSVLLFHHLRFAFVDKGKVEIFPLQLCWLFSLRLLNEVRGRNRARLLDNKSISAWTATLLKW